MCISEFLVESDEFIPGLAGLGEAETGTDGTSWHVTLPVSATQPSRDAYNGFPGLLLLCAPENAPHSDYPMLH